MLLATFPLRTYAIAATLIALLHVALATLTGALRSRSNVYANPEDVKLFKGTQGETDSPLVLRAKRAHLNLIESAVPFFAVGFLYALTNPTETGAEAYYAAFVIARVAHPVFYLAQLQPLRTVSYVVGTAAIVGMAIRVLRVAMT